MTEFSFMQIKRKSKKDIEDIMLSVGINQETGPGVQPLSEMTKAELIDLLGAAVGGYRE